MLREYAGAAKSTTLVGDITAGSAVITVADATGYPTGATGPFAIAMALGDAEEEKILILNRSGNTMNVHTRGYDGTSASAHSSGTTVDHVLTAIDVREANEHVNDSTGDPHPQYLLESDAITAYLAKAAPAQAKLDTAESTTSTTYADLATVGPTVTATVGASGRVLVMFHAWGRNSVADGGALVSIALSGANTVAPSDARAGITHSAAAGVYGSMSWSEIVTGLAEGSTTFTLRYRATANTATFANRRLIVIPL
jgi:hypothetical protein